MSVKTVLTLASCKNTQLPADAYVVFGGTFDPFHTGHLSVIRSLQSKFGTIIIAPTKQNPWKKRVASNFADRVKMIHLILSWEKINLAENIQCSGVSILDFEYIYAAEAARYLKNKRNGTIYWAVGAKDAETVSSWKDWKQLKITTISVPISVSVDASEIRSKRAPLHPAIRNYARIHRLYAE